MKTGSKYWSLVRLDSAGKLKVTEIVSTKGFFQQYFLTQGDRNTIADLAVQRDLVAVKNSQSDTSIEAERSLRCFISHQIRQVCIQLEMQFGREHGFSRNDLFIYSLNDTLDNFRDSVATRKSGSQYKPLAVEILETFDPQKANLSTWTTRFVKQNRELQRFLLEQGVYLISNWAILNDTNPKQLKRILSEFHSLTPVEIQRAGGLLTSYHQVYRRDRLKNRQTKGGKCQTPSTEQLERMASLIESVANLVLSPEQVLTQLEQLANLLREYRIYARGGRLKHQQSLDNAEMNTEAMQASVIAEEDNDNEDSRDDFLQSYQQQFQQSLDTAIAEVITNRLSKFKGKKAAKAPQFITALKLFHCQGEAMGKIAKAVGLKAQYQVSRLLNLKELRADIRHRILQLMTDWIGLSKLANPAELKQREQAIASALGEQIDRVLETAESEASVGDSNQSTLAKRICDYVDRLDRR